MKDEVAALVEAFILRIREAVRLEIHEEVRLELLEEMRAFAGKRQKRAPRRRRPKVKKRRVKPQVVKAAERRAPTLLERADRALESITTAGRFTTRDIRAAITVLKKNDATVHGKGCRRRTAGNCGKNCHVPVAIDPGSPLATGAVYEYTDQELKDGGIAMDDIDDVPDCLPGGVHQAHCRDAGKPVTPHDVDAPKPPLVMVPVPMPHPIVVRIDGKREPRIALLVASSADGEFFAIRLAQGRNRKYSKKVRRIIAAELLREATDREAVLGCVAPIPTHVASAG